MDSRGCFNLRNVLRPTILYSLIFPDLEILRDSVLDDIILLFVIQTNDCVVECLNARGCWQINVMEEQINAWGVHLNFFYVFKYINVKGFIFFTSVQLFQIFKSPLLRSWMLGLLLSVLSLVNFFFFSLLRTGTLRAHSCYFLLLRILYEYYNSYKARCTIKLFQ